MDLLGLDADLLERVRSAVEQQTGLARERLMLTASHNHSAPLTIPYDVTVQPRRDRDWEAQLVGRIAEHRCPGSDRDGCRSGHGSRARGRSGRPQPPSLHLERHHNGAQPGRAGRSLGRRPARGSVRGHATGSPLQPRRPPGHRPQHGHRVYRRLSGSSRTYHPRRPGHRRHPTVRAGMRRRHQRGAIARRLCRGGTGRERCWDRRPSRQLPRRPRLLAGRFESPAKRFTSTSS